MLAHEVQESASVGIRVSGRNFLTIAQVQPHLDVMLTFLLEVVALEVVDNGEVVDVAAAWRDIPMLITIVILSEPSNKLSYVKNKDGVYTGSKYVNFIITYKLI